ncbi:MAG TPA: hypothetical protein VK509_13795, partial [Polyangiales bacterium]|nr:hypothetical protein [Polyangiales bacterium]
ISLEIWERVVLYATYDKALVRGEELEAYAAACERFYAAYQRPGYACHLAEFARLAREAKQQGAVALGFCQTSVGESHWSVPPDDPDSDDAEWRPYDLSVDTDHWFVDCSEPQR